MMRLDSTTRAAMTALLNQVDVANAAENPADQVMLLSQALGIAPSETLFKILLLHRATASSARTAQAELTTAASRLETQTRELREQAEASEHARRPAALLRQYRSYLLALAAAGLVVGALFGALVGPRLTKAEGVPLVVSDNPAFERAVKVLSSPDGKAILSLIENGEAVRLANCEGQGWVKREGQCLPFPIASGSEAGRTQGWRTAR